MTIAPAETLQVDYVRQQFPALAGDWVFLDNAGGSQTLRQVVDRISEYLLTSDVQLGASYAISQLAGERVLRAREVVATLINAADSTEVVMGGSTSLLLRILSLCLGRVWSPGDEVVVTNVDHEANVSPWMDLRRQGIEVKIWQIRPDTLELSLEDLQSLLSPRTRLVAMVHASNILGTINPIRSVADLVHANGAMLCVDGVGYAAHRLVDVQALDVDFYTFSFYKAYGPHYSVLYGKQEHLLDIPGINHYFIDGPDIPYKFQPGNVNFELSYGMLGLCDYLSNLALFHDANAIEQSVRHRMVQAFELISAYEAVLGDRLLRYLVTKPNVRIIGLPHADQNQRVPTISFVVNGVDSATIPLQVDPYRIGIRYGDFYAKRLIQDLELVQQNGVVRVSMVHYNTIEEIDRLIECFERILN